MILHRIVTLVFVLSVAGSPLFAQRWEVVPAPVTSSLRGVSAPSAGVVWISGAQGTVARSVDAGATWERVDVPDADSLDFRDVAALDASTAYVLSIGNGAQSRIYRTTDGGRTWALQFTNPDSAAFFDCLAFWDARHGIAMSDPVDGRFRMLVTDDGGAEWRQVPPAAAPEALPGEAGFAASGTCVATGAPGEAWIVTGGGPRARALRTTDYGATWSASAITPIIAGAPPRGAFSVAVAGGDRLVATGGDYEQPTDTNGVVALSFDRGVTWSAARGPVPRGYRSGVAAVPGTNGDVVVAVGTSGTDYSVDGGRSWIPADTLALNAVTFVGVDRGWAVGPRGRVARWTGAFRAELPRGGKDPRED